MKKEFIIEAKRFQELAGINEMIKINKPINNEVKYLDPYDFDTFQWKDTPANPNAQLENLDDDEFISKKDFWDGELFPGRPVEDTIPTYGKYENGTWEFDWDGSANFKGFIEGEDFTL